MHGGHGTRVSRGRFASGARARRTHCRVLSQHPSLYSCCTWRRCSPRSTVPEDAHTRVVARCFCGSRPESPCRATGAVLSDSVRAITQHTLDNNGRLVCSPARRPIGSAHRLADAVPRRRRERGNGRVSSRRLPAAVVTCAHGTRTPRAWQYCSECAADRRCTNSAAADADCGESCGQG